MTKVPKFIAEQYGGSHEFRSKKRRLARYAKNIVSELRLGCAYFPAGNKDVDIAAKAIERIIKDISVKNWGR